MQGFRKAQEMLPMLHTLYFRMGSEKRAVRLLWVSVSNLLPAHEESQVGNATALIHGMKSVSFNIILISLGIGILNFSYIACDSPGGSTLPLGSSNFACSSSPVNIL